MKTSSVNKVSPPSLGSIHRDAMLGMIAGAETVTRNQETSAQREMVHADQLPYKGFLCEEFCNSDNIKETEAFKQVFLKAGGKIFGQTKGDPLMADVILPPGWTKKPTDHYMYTSLLDEKGRKRASIGYKGAFYDRWASFVTCRRLRSGYACDDYDEARGERMYHAEITDSNGKVLWRGLKIKEWTPEEVRQHKQSETEVLSKDAYMMLKKHYPDCDKVDAYWDIDTFTFPESLSAPPQGQKYTFTSKLYQMEQVELEESFCTFADMDRGYFELNSRRRGYDKEGRTEKRFRLQEKLVPGGSVKSKVFEDDKAAIKWWKANCSRLYPHYCRVETTIDNGKGQVGSEIVIRN